MSSCPIGVPLNSFGMVSSMARLPMRVVRYAVILGHALAFTLRLYFVTNWFTIKFLVYKFDIIALIFCVL